MKLFKSVLLTGLFASSISVFAAVPYTFTNGTPANASEINANFSALVSQIAALQAQLAGPTMASLAGTYNIVEMMTRVDSTGAPAGFNMQSEVGVGTVTLNADGTGSINSTTHSSFLNLSQSPVNVLTSINIINGSYVDGVYPVMGTVQGQQVVTSVSTHSATAVNSIIPSQQDVSSVVVSSNSNSTPDSGSFTWSLAGNVVTINAESALNFSVAGKIMVGADVNGLGAAEGIIILVRQ